jgi:hypothetical protein
MEGLYERPPYTITGACFNPVCLLRRQRHPLHLAASRRCGPPSDCVLRVRQAVIQVTNRHTPGVSVISRTTHRRQPFRGQ